MKILLALLLLFAIACVKDEYDTWRCKPYAVRYVSGAKCPDTLRFKTVYYPSLTHDEVRTIIRQNTAITYEIIGADTINTEYFYPCSIAICP